MTLSSDVIVEYRINTVTYTCKNCNHEVEFLADRSKRAVVMTPEGKEYEIPYEEFTMRLRAHYGVLEWKQHIPRAKLHLISLDYNTTRCVNCLPAIVGSSPVDRIPVDPSEIRGPIKSPNLDEPKRKSKSRSITPKKPAKPTLKDLMSWGV